MRSGSHCGASARDDPDAVSRAARGVGGGAGVGRVPRPCPYGPTNGVPVSRASKARTALVAAVGATLLAVGATAAPAQAAVGTTWISRASGQTMSWTNPAGRTCKPVSQYSCHD